jgi:hypothetical protein
MPAGAAIAVVGWWTGIQLWWKCCVKILQNIFKK